MAHPDDGVKYAKSPAENYERYFVPAVGAPVAAGLVESATLNPGERVLDVACGTGVAAKLAAEKVGPGGTVAGLDPNPDMLAVAGRTTPAGTSIRWYEAPAEAIPLPDESFDAVLCGMGLQFFSDKLAGLREMRRVLVPGGRLVASLPGPAPRPLEIMEDALARHVGPETAAFVRVVFSLHDADELGALMGEAGFQDVDIRSSVQSLDLPSPRDFLWQYIHSTPLADVVNLVDAEHREALEEEFTRECRSFVEDNRLGGQLGMTTVIARR